jgi:hypothetical protein
MKGAPHIADELNVPERVLLFCVASGTDWERAGLTGAVVTSAIVRGLIQRDPLGQLSLTKQGRASFQALIGGNNVGYRRADASVGSLEVGTI